MKSLLITLTFLLTTTCYSQDYSVSDSTTQIIKANQAKFLLIECYCQDKAEVKKTKNEFISLNIIGNISSVGYHGEQTIPKGINEKRLLFKIEENNDTIRLISKEKTVMHHAYFIEKLSIDIPLNMDYAIKQKSHNTKEETGASEVIINPIYFDANKYNIRTDAKVELDKLVVLMAKHPLLTIEISSHTDCRGSKLYNQILSQKRAKISLNYIKRKISNPKRIYGSGYGESNLSDKCLCKSTKTSICSKEQHQMNRRTEFVIISN